MTSSASGRKVLRFAVTGALLGGGVGAGCAPKTAPNVAPVEHPDVTQNVAPVGEPEVTEHTNPGPEGEPTEHVNTGPEADPGDAPPPDGPRVNTRKVDGPSGADAASGGPPPKVMVNPAPQPEPAA